MKTLIVTFILNISTLVGFSQNQHTTGQFNKAKPVYTVDASCGECNFKLKGKSCDLAVRIKGKAYFVDGTSIDQHGDAHADDGFCKAIRKARVQGNIVNNRFISTYFELID
ncbi:DUF6370 family protein [soil metagenome]